MDSIDRGLVRRVRDLRVWGSVPNIIKMDTAAVDPRLRRDESRGRGQYNVDGIATHRPGKCGVGLHMARSEDNGTLRQHWSSSRVANSGYSRAPRIMHLLRCLFFIRALFEFSLQAVHIEGTDNTVADAVSRNNHVFLDSQVFGPTYQRTSLPEELIFLLVVEQADWTSDRWTQLFKNCLQPA